MITTILTFVKNLFSKIKLSTNTILLVLVVGVFAYLIISNNVMSKRIDMLKVVNEQLKVNQEILINNSKEYVKLSDLNEFKQKMDSTTAAILKEQKIKPKWVDELIQTHVIYNNTDTTIVNTVYNEMSGFYEWSANRDCIDVEGYVYIDPSELVDVGLTRTSADITVTGVKYLERTKTFKVLGLPIYRYGPKSVLVTSASDCGESSTTITEIEK